VNIDIPGFCQNLVPYHQTTPEVQQAVHLQISLSVPSPISHNLRECKNKINYRVLHLGQEIQQATQDLKEKCKVMMKSVRKSAKASLKN
jgi:hypothetical protein